MRLCSLVLGAAISVLSLSAAQAAESDFMADPIYDSPMFNFDGIYVGIQAGGVWEWTPAPGVLAGDIGGMAGANFSINNALIAGVEFQADAYVDMTGVRGWDALFLGHFGGFVTDSAIIYAAVGAGTTDTTMVYALGAGVEAAVANQISARAEVLALAPWGAMPTGAKATLGLVWHVN
jgi:opacity protein-like surface antigen